MNAITTDELQLSSNRLKKTMRQLSIANEKIGKDIEERDRKVIMGTQKDIANGYINTNKGGRNSSADPEDRHIPHTMTAFIDDIILTCPTKEGRRARLINIPNSNSKDVPMELNKTGEELAPQHNDSL